MAHPLTLVRNFDYRKLIEELALTKEEKKIFDKFLAAYNGDFWQKGEGTLLPPPKAKFKDTLNPLFEKRYVSRNILREGVSRVSSAFLGRSPNWSYIVDGETIDLKELKREKKKKDEGAKIQARKKALGIPDDPVESEASGNNPRTLPQKPPTPPPDVEAVDNTAIEDDIDAILAENHFLEEMDKVLGHAWTSKGIAVAMSEAFESRLVCGRGGVHTYIQGKYKDKSSGELTEIKSLAAAVEAIELEYVDPKKSRMLRDDGELFSIIQYEKRENWETTDKTKIVEYSFVDDDNMTYVGVKREADKPGLPEAGTAELSIPLDLGGHPTFYEMEGKPYVTDQVFENNQLVNLSLTCGGFSIVDNGFGEMVLTNVDLDTEEVPDPDTESGIREVPKKIERGGGAVNNFLGVEMTNLSTGQVDRAPAGVHFRDPTPITTFRDGKELGYEACLEEMGQKYALISGDAMASGIARIQAMVDFYLFIRKYKPEIDRMGSAVLTVFLRMAAILCGRIEEFKDVSVLFDCQVRIGNLSAEEKRLVIEMRDKGIISYETARVLLDVENPGQEEDIIERETEKRALLNPTLMIPPPAAETSSGSTRRPGNTSQGNPAEV